MRHFRIVRPPSGFLLALSLVAACCGSLSCSSSSTPAAPTATSLAGIITDVVSGAAISGVAVAIQGASATTGSDGRYSITGLTAGQASLTAKHQGHVNFSQNVTLSGATTVNVPLTPSNAAKAAGNWAGTWRNTTFGSAGTVAMVVSTDTIAQTMRVTVTLTGNVLGAGTPPPITVSGSYTTTGANITAVTMFGNATLVISSTGQITGSLTNIPGGGISRFDITGTATTSTININYTVTFVGGQMAAGVATLIRQ